LVDGVANRSASLGSPGMDEVRWPAPVRPGDVLTATFAIDEARPSATKPDRGIVRSFCEMRNQDDVVVMTMCGTGMYYRRPD
jgi:acyl dehydratase